MWPVAKREVLCVSHHELTLIGSTLRISEIDIAEAIKHLWICVVVWIVMYRIGRGVDDGVLGNDSSIRELEVPHRLPHHRDYISDPNEIIGSRDAVDAYGY